MLYNRIKKVSVGAAFVVLTVFLVSGCGSEKDESGEQVLSVGEQLVQTESSTQEETEETVENKTEEELLEERVEQYISAMTLEQKAAQLFVVTPESITDVNTVTAAGSATKEALQKYPVGGIVYLKQNLLSESQTSKMLANTKRYYEEIMDLPVFLAVDEEGGTVARIGANDGFSIDNVGSMKTIGESEDPQNAYHVGVIIGTYLSELGFNLDFAPVADVLTNPENEVVADRSFGSDHSLVTEMVLAELDGLNQTDVLGCVKHFPGHGSTAGDTHDGYAYTEKNLEELWENEFQPFQAAVDADVPFVMVSHISVPNVIGDDTPSSLSYIMVTEILRNRMGYEGIVITDAMNMGAIVEDHSESAAVKALQAGVDMILMPENFETSYNDVLEAAVNGTLSQERIDASVKRILRLKLSME